MNAAKTVTPRWPVFHRVLFFLLSVVGTCWVFFPQVARGLTIVWDTNTYPHPGIQVRRGHSVNPARYFYAAFISLCHDHVHVVATAPPTSYRTTGNWASSTGVQLAVNGDFFQYAATPFVYGDAVGAGIHWPSSQTGVDDVNGWYYRRYGWIAVGPGWVEFSHSRHVKENVAAFRAAGYPVQQGWYPETVTTDIPAGTVALVSGFPELVSEGVVIQCPDPTGGCFPDRGDMALDEYHLRTAMGITEDRNTLIFVIVTTPCNGVELAQLIKEVGAWQAFNLDGGGSSTLWVSGSGYLHPSGVVREVSNHWGVFAGSGSGQPSEPGSCHVLGGCFHTPVAGAENEDFKDFPASWLGHGAASVLLDEGITQGCAQNPERMFCPKCPITRGQLAVFLARAAGLDTSNPPATPTFSDVPTSHSQYAYIEAIAAAGITTGCGGGEFCPRNPVSRGQAAAFMRRAAGWPSLNPAVATFGDVDPNHLFYGDIEAIADRCVTNGCGGGDYCPDALMDRAQAAIFLCRTFDLQDYNPCWDPCSPQSEMCDGQDNDCDGDIDEGLTTRPCEQSNGFGTCNGTETCGGADGWIDCTAKIPTAEVCGNGEDDDCNGFIDDGCVGIDATVAPEGGVDAVVITPDGGLQPDGAVDDGASSSDGSEAAHSTMRSGCSCKTTPSARFPLMLILLALASFVARGRQR